MSEIDKLWEYACSGDIAALKEYYDNGGSINNRFFKFGEGHSLIMGAFRNGHFDTVEYLMSQGEQLSKKEHADIMNELRRFEVMKAMVGQEEQNIDMSQTQSM